MAKIDRKLNIVFEVETAAGATAHICSTPVNEMVFDKFCLIMAKAYGMLIREGTVVVTGPRIAARIVKKIAEQEGTWEGADGVQLGLHQEIRRLTQVMYAGKGGWETLPLDDAQRMGILDSEACADVENQLMFFTLASWMARGKPYVMLMADLKTYWELQQTSLPPMEYLASLRTSTKVESSSAKVAA